MKWEDNALLLSVAKKASDTLVLHVFTEQHGRCKCLLDLKKDDLTLLLPGCDLRISYTPGALGSTGNAELLDVNNGIIVESKDDIAVQVMGHVTTLLSDLFPVNQPTKQVFPKLAALLGSLSAHDGRWGLYYAVFEFAVLAELGASSNLERCRSAFRHGETIYITKSSGRAVTREEAGVFLDRTMPVPGLLMGARNAKTADLRHALELNQMLCARAQDFDGKTVTFPPSRQGLVETIAAMTEVPKYQDAQAAAQVTEDDRRRRLLAMRQLVVGERSAQA